MQLSDFDFTLPKEAIAQIPADQRDGSRLLELNGKSGKIVHRVFRDLPELLRSGDLLVLNNTRVRPARLVGSRESGGRVEALVLEDQPGSTGRRAYLKSRAKLKEGERLGFEEGALFARTTQRLGGGLWSLSFDQPDQVDGILARVGRAPLPPYISRSPDEQDAERGFDLARYQSIFAEVPGSVAAPTASLHFTDELLSRIEERGVETARVTLHVGLGTFLPIKTDRVEDHVMHEEIFSVPSSTVEKVLAAKKQGGRVVCVGTTACRALEAAAESFLAEGSQESEGMAPGTGIAGETRLFIRPPYEFRWVDALITNFHLPRSTLILLVCALAGREEVQRAYVEALAQGYRFYSYGDAMFIG